MYCTTKHPKSSVVFCVSQSMNSETNQQRIPTNAVPIIPPSLLHNASIEFHSNFICRICWSPHTRRRRLSASKILQSEGSLASNWQRSLFSSPRWLTDGAKRSENSVGQGCSLRPSTCIKRIIGSSNQPPKPGFVDDVTTFSNLKNLPFFFF